jgi:hypothetical protein
MLRRHTHMLELVDEERGMGLNNRRPYLLEQVPNDLALHHSKKPILPTPAFRTPQPQLMKHDVCVAISDQYLEPVPEAERQAFGMISKDHELQADPIRPVPVDPAPCASDSRCPRQAPGQPQHPNGRTLALLLAIHGLSDESVIQSNNSGLVISPDQFARQPAGVVSHPVLAGFDTATDKYNPH